jgi:hypothetical protein
MRGADRQKCDLISIIFLFKESKLESEYKSTTSVQFTHPVFAKLAQ